MEKAWDLKDLLGRVKSKGLDAAEQVLTLVAVESLDWAADSVEKSDGKVINFIKPFVPLIVPPIKKVIVEAIDNLDGEDDTGDGIPAAPEAPEAPVAE